MSAGNGPGLARAGADTGAAGAAGTAAAAGDADNAGSGARPRPGRWAWPAGYTLAAILLFLCYLRISGTQAVTSDGASMALQAWDMLHGNWLLHGWTLTDVSFYTTELPEYVLVEVFRGLGPQDVHTAAALTYTLLVVLAGLLAKGNKTGREGLVRVLIAAGIMIAPQVGPGAFLLLLSPDHTGTGVPLLLIFLLLDRTGRRPWVPAAAGLLLAWAQIGDRIVITIGVLPVVAVCVARVGREAVRRRGVPRECWFEAALAVSAVASVLVADVFAKIIKHFGGYAAAPLNTRFSPIADWPSHAMLALKGILGLYAADVDEDLPYRRRGGRRGAPHRPGARGRGVRPRDLAVLRRHPPDRADPRRGHRGQRGRLRRQRAAERGSGTTARSPACSRSGRSSRAGCSPAG